MVYLPVKEYRSAMDGLQRNRACAEAQIADWPQGTPTWAKTSQPGI